MSKKKEKVAKAPRPVRTIVVSNVKPASSLVRYGLLREVGVRVNGSEAILRGEELDKHLDSLIFRLQNPGKPETKDFP